MMKKLLTLFVASVMASGAVAQLDIAALASAMDNPGRPAADKERDSNRKAPEELSFLGLEAGMTAMDLIAIGGGQNLLAIDSLHRDDDFARLSTCVDLLGCAEFFGQTDHGDGAQSCGYRSYVGGHWVCSIFVGCDEFRKLQIETGECGEYDHERCVS